MRRPSDPYRRRGGQFEEFFYLGPGCAMIRREDCERRFGGGRPIGLLNGLAGRAGLPGQGSPYARNHVRLTRRGFLVSTRCLPGCWSRRYRAGIFQRHNFSKIFTISTRSARIITIRVLFLL